MYKYKEGVKEEVKVRVRLCERKVYEWKEKVKEESVSESEAVWEEDI